MLVYLRHRIMHAVLEVRAGAAALAFGICLALMLPLAACLNEPTESSPEYLPLDDSRYPYADVPRIVIETEDFHEIRDRETKFPSHLQIYGENAPESGVYSLTVRGRGNSSFMMPKYGLKLEFTDKVSLFGMPANRDWALIGNYGDKTHLRNFMMTRLSEWLGSRYTPRCRYVELYLNRKYMGLYLLSETVKVGKHRVNIAKNDSSFLFEKESEKKQDPPLVISSMGFPFHVKNPQNLSPESAEMLRSHLDAFEAYLREPDDFPETGMRDWIDVDDFMPYYWVQEYSKNEDGRFGRSIFITWEKGSPMRFGPLWDFDISFGNESYKENRSFDGWYIRRYYWFGYIFRDVSVRSLARDYWLKHKKQFESLIDSVPLYASNISRVLKNEYRRWPIMKNTENWALKDPYEDYDEALDSLVLWMKARYDWINDALE